MSKSPMEHDFVQQHYENLPRTSVSQQPFDRKDLKPHHIIKKTVVNEASQINRRDNLFDIRDNKEIYRPSPSSSYGAGLSINQLRKPKECS